jgi:hypothetical protein
MVKTKGHKTTPPVKETPNKSCAKRRQAPATTVEGREHQLITMTIDLAERQIRAGTASSQVMTHFLKLGSSMENLEKEKLHKENLLLEAKTDALKSAKRVEELYAKALKAMQIYAGKEDGGLSDDED